MRPQVQGPLSQNFEITQTEILIFFQGCSCFFITRSRIFK